MHVILASGWGKADLGWRKYRKWWEAEGVTTSVLQSKAGNFGPLQAASRQLARQINDLAQPPVIVGHSAGGVIARHCLAKYQPEVAGLVTIASPHGGSKWAKLAPWSYSACQLQPNSNFIRRMEPLGNPNCPMLNIFCSHDLIVSQESAVIHSPSPNCMWGEVPQTHFSVLLSHSTWKLIHGFAEECITTDFSMEQMTPEQIAEILMDGEDDDNTEYQ